MESITTYLLFCCAMSGHVTMPAQWSKWVNIFDALYPLWVDIDVWLNCTWPPCFIQFVNSSNPNISRNFHLLGCFFGDCLGLEAFDHGPQSGRTSTAGRIGTVCPRFYDFSTNWQNRWNQAIISTRHFDFPLTSRVFDALFGVLLFLTRGDWGVLAACYNRPQKFSHVPLMRNWTETTAFLKVVDAQCL